MIYCLYNGLPQFLRHASIVYAKLINFCNTSHISEGNFRFYEIMNDKEK